MQIPRLLIVAAGVIALSTIPAVRSADAGPITCAGIGSGGKPGFAIVDPAVNCTGTGVFGVAASGANDNVSHLNGLGVYGTGWELLTGFSIPNNTNLGSFLLDPMGASFMCTGSQQCANFIVAIKWDGLMSYFLLGSLLSATTIDWESQPFAGSHINVYGNLTAPPPTLTAAPEPGTLMLVGVGLALGARRLRKRGPPAR